MQGTKIQAFVGGASGDHRSAAVGNERALLSAGIPDTSFLCVLLGMLRI